mgnify:CR=1 FL=1
MRAIVTVLGKDRVGIMSLVCSLLAERNVNILDISQTIMQDMFTMIMLVDTGACACSELSEQLNAIGEKMGLDIRLQHEDLFKSMHRI